MKVLVYTYLDTQKYLNNAHLCKWRNDYDFYGHNITQIIKEYHVA